MNLDARQRAMLEEMHVRVWWPTAEDLADTHAAQTPAVASSAVQHHAASSAMQPPVVEARAADAPPAASSLPTSPHMPMAATPHAERVPSAAPQPDAAQAPRQATVAPAAATSAPVAAQGGWPALLQQVAECNACGLCTGRKTPLLRPGPDALPQQRDWLVVGEPPTEAEERAGAAFVGEAGQLLDNMLRAVQVSRSAEGAAGAWATNVVQCRPAMARIPEPDELLRCRDHIDQQIALLRPKVILAMGRFATQSLLGSDNPALVGKPFGQLRGSVHAHAGVPVVVMQHPERLLRAPAQKAEAWADLCRALEIVRGG